MTIDQRKGILAGGNFIIDHVKIIDAYPPENTLASILSESSANGGGPYNVLKDLSAMGAPFPLAAAGLVGRDADGDRILEDCRAHGIDTAQLHRGDAAPTSYTDAMTVASTGRRTFFHQRGANAHLDVSHFDLAGSNARLFHLAYLMLLDKLDALNENGLTGAAELLAAARDAGMITTADLVSVEHAQFCEVTNAALPHLDYLIINEIEAAKMTGRELQRNSGVDVSAAIEAARAIRKGGARHGVVIHFEGGAVALDKDGNDHVQGSLDLPRDFIAGATGAGDAFAAGYLYGIHEGLSTSECLRHAMCTAAACLSHPTTSGGMMTLADCLALGDRFGFRKIV